MSGCASSSRPSRLPDSTSSQTRSVISFALTSPSLRGLPGFPFASPRPPDHWLPTSVAMATTRETAPWDGLLEEGRGEQLVRQARYGAQPPEIEPLPDDLHPALLEAQIGRASCRERV